MILTQSCWRVMGCNEEDLVQLPFELEENEAVVAVRSNAGCIGFLRGLGVTTSTGRQISWGDLDKDFEFGGQKRRSVVENAKLAYCSGLVQTDGGGRSITFHWILDADDLCPTDKPALLPLFPF